MLSIWHCIWRWQLPPCGWTQKLGRFYFYFYFLHLLGLVLCGGSPNAWQNKMLFIWECIGGGNYVQEVGIKNLANFLTFMHFYFQFNLGRAITKCKLQKIVFKCYLFQGAFVDDYLHPNGLKKLLAFKNIFLGFVFCRESSRENTTLLFVSFQLVFSWIFLVHSPFIYFG